MFNKFVNVAKKILKKLKIKNYKKMYKQLQQEFTKTKYQLTYLQEHSDISKLKPATGKVRQIQLDLLNYANEFFKEIQELNIKPFLSGGNLIGAVRNNSFIPWDDDLDFGLLREDYEVLIKYCFENYICTTFDIKTKNFDCKSQLKEFERLICENPNQYILVVKYDMIQLIKGTSLKDIMVLDFFSYDFYDDSNYTFLEHEQYIRDLYKKINGINKYCDVIKYLEQEKKNNNNIVLHSNNMYFGIDNGDACTVMGKNNSFIPSQVILPLRKIKFEGYDFYAPNDPLKYLSFRYTDINSWPDDMGFGQHGYSL